MAKMTPYCFVLYHKYKYSSFRKSAHCMRGSEWWDEAGWDQRSFPTARPTSTLYQAENRWRVKYALPQLCTKRRTGQESGVYIMYLNFSTFFLFQKSNCWHARKLPFSDHLFLEFVRQFILSLFLVPQENLGQVIWEYLNSRSHKISRLGRKFRAWGVTYGLFIRRYWCCIFAGTELLSFLFLSPQLQNGGGQFF